MARDFGPDGIYLYTLYKGGALNSQSRFVAYPNADVPGFWFPIEIYLLTDNRRGSCVSSSDSGLSSEGTGSVFQA